MSLSALIDELSQARTKKKEYLEQMDQLIPWGKWVEEIRPCYYKPESVKLNGFAMAREPPLQTLVGTSSQGHIGIQIMAQQPGR